MYFSCVDACFFCFFVGFHCAPSIPSPPFLVLYSLTFFPSLLPPPSFAHVRVCTCLAMMVRCPNILSRGPTTMAEASVAAGHTLLQETTCDIRHVNELRSICIYLHLQWSSWTLRSNTAFGGFAVCVCGIQMGVCNVYLVYFECSAVGTLVVTFMPIFVFV
jgi:hypothetical protein